MTNKKKAPDNNPGSKPNKLSDLVFADVRRQAPPIIVTKAFLRKGVEEKLLFPTEYDDIQSGDRPLDLKDIEGKGTLSNPYQYKFPAPVSPHYFIVDLWLKYRESFPSVYIMVNDMTFMVKKTGVLALPSLAFTKLLPD